MRRLLLVPGLSLLAALGGCKPKHPVGTKELLEHLTADFRAQVARDYPACDYGTAVQFDGSSVYRGRAWHRDAQGTANSTLVFDRAGDGWRCVDAESKAPDAEHPCRWAQESCVRKP